jgi:hypothetical protein
VSAGFVGVILGLGLAEFAINSFASNDWSPPATVSIQYFPGLGLVALLVGMLLILFGFTDEVQLPKELTSDYLRKELTNH